MENNNKVRILRELLCTYSNVLYRESYVHKSEAPVEEYCTNIDKYRATLQILQNIVSKSEQIFDLDNKFDYRDALLIKWSHVFLGIAILIEQFYHGK